MSKRIRAKEITVLFSIEPLLKIATYNEDKEKEIYSVLQELIKKEIVNTYTLIIEEGKIKISNSEEEIKTEEQLNNIFKWVCLWGNVTKDYHKIKDKAEILYNIGHDYLTVKDGYIITQLKEGW